MILEKVGTARCAVRIPSRRDGVSASKQILTIDFMPKLTIRDLNVRGKRVFVRVDYNVPLEEKDGQMVITDATRIVETLPTLKMLIEQGGRLILAAHLGRPKGQRESTMSLRPVAARLADLLGRPVAFVDD